MEVSGQLHAQDTLPSRERVPGTHWIGYCVDPRTGLEAVLKRRIPSSRGESKTDHPILQPVANRSTD
jgi:hypothetical protein